MRADTDEAPYGNDPSLAGIDRSVYDEFFISNSGSEMSGVSECEVP